MNTKARHARLSYDNVQQQVYVENERAAGSLRHKLRGAQEKVHLSTSKIREAEEELKRLQQEREQAEEHEKRRSRGPVSVILMV